MNSFNGLAGSLNRYFKWHKSRMDCFAGMLLSIFRVRSINLSEVAVGFTSERKIESRYRRLKKFFTDYSLDFDKVALFLYTLFFAPDKKVYLTMDRTNWFWGKAKINIFVLGIAYEGMAIPIFWRLLPKAGSSNFEEQRALIKRFIKLFGKTQIEGLLADREFGNGRLFGWLNKQSIPFYIRIKEGSQVCIKQKKLFNAQKIFKDLSPKTKKEYPMAVWIFGQKVFLYRSSMKNRKKVCNVM